MPVSRDVLNILQSILDIRTFPFFITIADNPSGPQDALPGIESIVVQKSSQSTAISSILVGLSFISTWSGLDAPGLEAPGLETPGFLSS